MNRDDLQNLTMARLSDAKALFATGSNDTGAYYMAGYAVECAIKACIARNMGEYPFPPRLKEKELNEFYYTHNLENLLKAATLNDDFGVARGASPPLDANWTIVIAWSEQSRYVVKVDHSDVAQIIHAIEDPVNGVLTWLKKYW